jgi:hypothetical protein
VLGPVCLSVSVVSNQQVAVPGVSVDAAMCAFCELTTDGYDIDGCMGAAAVTMRCPLCQMAWHEACCGKVAQHLGGRKSSVVVKGIPAEVTADVLCLLCKQWKGV